MAVETSSREMLASEAPPPPTCSTNRCQVLRYYDGHEVSSLISQNQRCKLSATIPAFLQPVAVHHRRPALLMIEGVTHELQVVRPEPGPATPSTRQPSPNLRVRLPGQLEDIRYPSWRAQSMRALTALTAIWSAFYLSASGPAIGDMRGVGFALAFLYAFQALYANVTVASACRSVKSYVFLLTVSAVATDSLLDYYRSVRLPIAGLTLTIVCCSSLLHCGGRCSQPGTALCAYAVAVVGYGADAIRQSILEEDPILFSFGSVRYTYLSVKRACVVTMCLALVLLVIMHMQTASSANFPVLEHAQHREVLAELALGLPARALTKLRAAQKLRRSAATEVAERQHASCASRHCLAFSKVPGTRRQQWHHAWAIADTLCKSPHLTTHARTMQQPARLTYGVAAGAVAGIAFLARQVFRRTGVHGLPLALSIVVVGAAIPMCVILWFFRNTNTALLKQVCKVPSTIMTLIWAGFLACLDVYSGWIELEGIDKWGRIVFVCAQACLMLGFSMSPALLTRKPVLEAMLVVLGVTSQSYYLYVYSVNMDTTPVVVALPNGRTITQQDIRRTAFLQLCLCLVRLGVHYGREGVRHRRRRSASILNVALTTSLPRLQDINAYVLMTVWDIIKDPSLVHSDLLDAIPAESVEFLRSTMPASTSTVQQRTQGCCKLFGGPVHVQRLHRQFTQEHVDLDASAQA